MNPLMIEQTEKERLQRSVQLLNEIFKRELGCSEPKKSRRKIDPRILQLRRRRKFCKQYAKEHNVGIGTAFRTLFPELVHQ